MLVWLVLLACNGSDDDVPPDSGPVVEAPAPLRETSCDPLEPEICAFPWPSSYFQAPDEGSASGVRWNLADDTLPRHKGDEAQIEPGFLGHTDGASTLTPFLTFFPDVSLEGTVPVDDLGRYADADIRSVLVNAATGERVPHFVELDTNAAEGMQTMFLRPVVPLEHGTRYVVGFRNLETRDGGPVAPSPAFQALRDGTAEGDDAAWRQPHMDAHVFAVLADAGFPREELTLAWDVTTGSLDGTLGAMVAMRDDALERVGADGPPYVIDSVTDDDCSSEGATIARTIEGHFVVPRYTDSDTPPAFLVRDEAGMPVVQGETEPKFILRVPCSVAARVEAGGEPAPLMVYGHGLLGNLSEARTGHLSHFANDYGWVVFAMTWVGMSDLDALVIPGVLSQDLSDFPSIPERSMQGLVNKLTGLRAVRGAMRSDEALTMGGHPLLSDEVGYYGISQGGILGGAYMALSTDVERGVFGVGGMPYSLLLDRSHDFTLFGDLLRLQFSDPREYSLLVAGLQQAWDVGEGSGYAHVLTENPLPGTPAKGILMQVAIGDGQVTTLGAHVGARALGAVTLEPAVRPIWGVDEVAGPVEGPVLVEWSYPDADANEPLENQPAGPGDTHECPRREPEAQEQLDHFLRTGVVEQTCDGPCVAECKA